MLDAILVLVLTIFPPGTWHWDPSSTADGYEFCWTYDVQQWSRALCVDVGQNNSFLPSVELEETVWTVPPGGVLFFQVCAYNAAGYDADCADFDPVPPDWECPDGVCP